MTGELLRWSVGPPTETAIDIALTVVASISIISVVIAVELLLQTKTYCGVATAVLLACSPFLVDQLVYQRRPDQLGVAVLVGLGLGLVYTTRLRLPLCSIAGLFFGILCLIHEGIALYDLPIATAMVVLLMWEKAGGWQSIKLVAATLIPSLFALGAVLLAGTPSVSFVQRLRDRATVQLNGPTMFDFLSDSAGDSLYRVVEDRHSAQLGMLILGVSLILLHRAWLIRVSNQELFHRMGCFCPRSIRYILLAFIGIGTLMTFALGIDWLRWFSELGSAWLLATTVLILQHNRPRPSSYSTTLSFPLYLPLLAVYLASMPPLNETLGIKGLAKVLVPFW